MPRPARQCPRLFARIFYIGIGGLEHSKAEIMSDQERTRQREHWQAIAEQLGLAREGEPSPEEPEEAVEPYKTEPYARAPADVTEADLSAAETRFAAAEVEAGPETLEEDQRDEEEAAPQTPVLTSPLDAESEEMADDKRERPSRSRGRRGQRGRSEPSSTAVEEEQKEEDVASLTEDAAPERSGAELERRRGRRGRGRPSRETTDQSSESESAQETGGQESEADDEIEELGDFSNWNVPSWNELIASLYRPER